MCLVHEILKIVNDICSICFCRVWDGFGYILYEINPPTNKKNRSSINNVPTMHVFLIIKQTFEKG